jgi:hypothetical protein
MNISNMVQTGSASEAREKQRLPFSLEGDSWDDVVPLKAYPGNSERLP